MTYTDANDEEELEGGGGEGTREEEEVGDCMPVQARRRVTTLDMSARVLSTESTRAPDVGCLMTSRMITIVIRYMPIAVFLLKASLQDADAVDALLIALFFA